MYTIRMLVDDIFLNNESLKSIQLKPYAHFTLGCTADNECTYISNSFSKLAEYFNGKITFSAEKVLNLGTSEFPLYCVKLNLGEHEQELRCKLGELFDPIMCPERNGTLYCWNLNSNQGEVKCPHITIGSREEDYTTAKKMVDSSCTFTFSKMDYKIVGPHDPIVSQVLSASNKFKITLL